MGRTRLYINGGGSLMQDVTSRRSLWFYLFTISAAKKLGNRVLMYGCGIGPIHYPSNRRLVRQGPGAQRGYDHSPGHPLPYRAGGHGH